MAGVKEQLRKTGLYRVYSDLRWRERTVSNGDAHKDISFYVIRRHSEQSGLFSFFGTNLGSIKEALDRGMTPVVDMRDTKSVLLTADEVYKVNAWERYFEQPAGYTLADTDRAHKVTLSVIHPPADFPDHRIFEEGNGEKLVFWRELAHKYACLKAAHEEAASRYIAATLGDGPVLGLLVRGTDYTERRPKGHPVQPEIRDVIERADAHLKKHDMKNIYLATEDESIWNAFNERFPGQVFSYQTGRFAPGDGTLLAERGDAPEGKTVKDITTEYLVSMRVLSKCTDLIAGATSGTVGAVLMSDGYREQYVYMLGEYS